MTLQGEQLAAPAVPGDHHVEQVLLGLADGSYVLSTPDGRIAECGLGVAAMLSARPDELAGHPVADVVASAADPAQRDAFERMLRGEPDDRVFPAATADGAPLALSFVVISVPLALGWEFTSLLSELGSRDADSWQPEELRVRHERALGAVESVCLTGHQPDPGARLAGILVVVRDADAPPLTRHAVGERMEAHRAAAREAKEAARRAQLGLTEVYEEPQSDGPGLDDLVERAHELRERLEAAEQEAVAAHAERERALERLAIVEAERDADAGHLQAERAELVAQYEQALTQLTDADSERAQALSALEAARAEHVAERGRILAQLQTVEAERGRALAQSASEQAERVRVLARLEAEQAERAQLLAHLAEVEAERDAERRHREAAEEHASGTQQSAHGRLQQLTSERDEAFAAATDAGAGREQAEAARAQAQAELETARAEARAAQTDAQAARTAADDARAETENARGESEHARAELQALRDSIDAERASILTADTEMRVLRTQLEAAQSGAEAARAELQAAREDAQAARGEHTLTRGELAAVRGELDGARGALDQTRHELDAVRSRPVASPDELHAVKGELDAARSQLAAIAEELRSAHASADEARAERDEARERAAELLVEADRARAAVMAIRAEFSFERPSAGARTAAAGSPQRMPFTAPAPRTPAPLAAAPQDSPRADAPELPDCEPGFAVALIGLDGRFKRLDGAFQELLGAGEDELRNARWPSIIDRDNLAAHAEIARALRAGDIRSADVETIYMHARGLLVPVEGTVTMHRDASGAEHFLFRADVRRTSGAPR